MRRHDTIGTRPTKCSSTIPDVFIIETLKLTDEAADRSEGVLLSAAMRLSAKHPRYAYLRTGQEMSVFLGQFCTSQYRYLHLSCHGNEDVLATTLDVLPFGKVGPLLRPYLVNRRLFISACSAVNDELAAKIMRLGGCRSIVGPTGKVGFAQAAAFWIAFYERMFDHNPNAMAPTTMEQVLSDLQTTFQLPISYINRRRSAPYWTRMLL